MAKKKDPPRDGGISPKQAQQLRSAIRKVWSWSYARKLCIKRSTGVDGFPICEKCGTKPPKVFVDHIEPCGALGNGYFDRMFVDSTKLMALCAKCHAKKTRLDNAALEVDVLG